MQKIILLIDDDSDDRLLFCEALEEITPSIACHTVASGRMALSKLTNGEIGLPDLIFLDVNMPVMDGWECLAALKRAADYRHIPVIMYSTSSYKEDIEKAQTLGALCFFTKPFQFKELKKNLTAFACHLSNDTLNELAAVSPVCNP